MLELEGTGGDTHWCLTALAREALSTAPHKKLDPANEDNPNDRPRLDDSPPVGGVGAWLGLGANVTQRSARFATQYVRSAGLRLAAASHTALLWLAQEPDAGD